MTITKNLKTKLPKNGTMVINQGYYTDGRILLNKDYVQTSFKDFNIAMQYNESYGVSNGKYKMEKLPDLKPLIDDAKKFIDNMDEVNFLYDTKLIDTSIYLNKKVYTTYKDIYVYLNTVYTDYLDQFKNIGLISSKEEDKLAQIILFDKNTAEVIGILMPVQVTSDNEFLADLK